MLVVVVDVELEMGMFNGVILHVTNFGLIHLKL